MESWRTRPQSWRGVDAGGPTLSDVGDLLAVVLGIVAFAVLYLLIEGIDRV